MRLRQVLVLSRDLARSTQFYQEGLGLKLLRSSETFAEFDTQSSVPLCVKLAQSEAACSTGYSPFLNFDIQDLSEAVPRLLMLGAIMDGPIKYPAHGKVRTAVHRSLSVRGILNVVYCICRSRRCARRTAS
jgi:catechol 2,3-dioxygenase-like lactoylglutathione lyase family enzyme